MNGFGYSLIISSGHPVGEEIGKQVLGWDARPTVPLVRAVVGGLVEEAKESQGLPMVNFDVKYIKFTLRLR